MALLTLVATGCYRSTGLQRTPLAAEEIPESGGDRVAGLKSTAGPGDYYLGNDFIQIALDGSPFGQGEEALAGAAAGGSIVDAGYVMLDTSYRRVSPPGDALDRLTPVVNQDLNLELVFDRFTPQNLGDTSVVTMTGYLLDPGKTIQGASYDSAGRVAGVSVTHVASLGSLHRYVTLKTIVTNNTSVPLGIRNIGDALVQQGGGYRAAVPATYGVDGTVLSPRWGMEIPGNMTASPLASAVKAPMIGLLNSEPAADTMDSHASLGILPLDGDDLVVNCDAQHPLTDFVRPTFPQRVVAGSVPVASLAPGASLTYNRRLYIVGGQSISTSAPAGASGLFNAMDQDRYTDLRVKDFGEFDFSLSGTAITQGPLPSEIRIERNVGTSAVPVWQLVRVDWLEPTENTASAGSFSGSTIGSYLPVGTYRVVVRNKDDEFTKNTFINSWIDPDVTTDDPDQYLPQPLTILSEKYFITSDLVAPELKSTTDDLGNVVSDQFSVYRFNSHERDSDAGSIQPLRISILGTNGTANPVMRRQRSLATYFSSLTKGPELAAGLTAGQYQFRAGNELFGTGITNGVSAEFVWLPNPKPGAASNTYQIYGSRGPLSYLAKTELEVYQGQLDDRRVLTIFPMGLPTGWTSFDMPGPSQATTGGFTPAEKLASAMAEGVQVVAHTEQDRQVDSVTLYNNFRTEFYYTGFTDAMRPASLSDMLRATYSWGSDPFVVGARSSSLSGYGTVSALFTPTATGARNGGARKPSAWTLADFLKQAEGQYNVVNRPRGPQGLFQVQGFNPAVALGQGVNAWWTGGGLYSFGRTNGSFEALELLRGEGFDGSNPDPWFTEFKQVRSDWFAILNQQTPTAFTKALGLSSATFSVDTPVGLARTYLKATPTVETDLSSVLSALKSGAAVASTGPFLDVTVAGAGPGGLVAGPIATTTVQISLTKTDWMPVDQVRVVMNGQVVATVAVATLTPSSTDARVFTGSVPVTLPSNGKDAWIVVEAGVPLTTTGVYAAGSPWNQVMRGIYPIAVTNPIFVGVTGGAYKPPML